jgi:hypothetical protein
MELKISSLSEECVEFKGRVLRQEFREQMKLLDMSVDRSGEFLQICSWCKRVNLPESSWVEAEEAIRALDLFGSYKLPQLTHGVCPLAMKK